MSDNQIGQLRVYACGGTGVNIAKQLRYGVTEGYAQLNPAYIDTSRANLDESISEEHVFVVPRETTGAHRSEGSGKDRTANEQVIYDAVPAIMSKFPPQDLNVVVFSGSGGTGCVAGAFIMDYLLEVGANAIAIVIGTEESARAARNTFGTLKTLEGICERVGRPVVVNYLHQPRTATRASVDDMAIAAISALATYVCRNLDELDLEDIHNLLDYTQVTEVGPQLTLLEIYADPQQLEADMGDTPIIGLGAVLRNKDQILPNVAQLYDAIGYYRDEAERHSDVYFVITTTGMDRILSTMVNNEAKAEAALHAQAPTARFSTATTNARPGRTRGSSTGLLR